MLVKFEGLDELIKEFESIATDNEINKANAKILDLSAKVVEKNLKPKVHRSKNTKNSGLKGLKTGQHAANNIAISKVKNTKGFKFVEIGWDQTKNEPYSYMQWEEWGNTTREPHALLYPTIKASRAEMNNLAINEYENLIKNLK